jgi:hypothetical protein
MRKSTSTMKVSTCNTDRTAGMAAPKRRICAAEYHRRFTLDGFDQLNSDGSSSKNSTMKVTFQQLDDWAAEAVKVKPQNDRPDTKQSACLPLLQ